MFMAFVFFEVAFLIVCIQVCYVIASFVYRIVIYADFILNP